MPRPINILVIAGNHPSAKYWQEETIQWLEEAGYTYHQPPDQNTGEKNVFTNLNTVSGATLILLGYITAEAAVQLFANIPETWRRKTIIIEGQSYQAEFSLAGFSRFAHHKDFDHLLEVIRLALNDQGRQIPPSITPKGE